MYQLIIEARGDKFPERFRKMLQRVPTRLLSFSVKGLYGRRDYSIDFQKNEGYSILAAPNGYGKSTILKIIRAVSNGNLLYLRILPFVEITLSVMSTGGEVSKIVIKHLTGKNSKADPLALSVKINKEKAEIFDFNDVKHFASVLIRDKFLEYVGPNLESCDTDTDFQWRYKNDDSGKILGLVEVYYDYFTKANVHFPGSAFVDKVKEYFRLSNIYISANRLVASSIGGKQKRASINQIVECIRYKYNVTMQNFAIDSREIDAKVGNRIFEDLDKTQDVESLKSEISGLEKQIKEKAEIASEFSIFRNSAVRTSEAEDPKNWMPEKPKKQNAHTLVIYKALLECTLEKYKALDDFVGRMRLFKKTLINMLDYPVIDISSYGIDVFTDSAGEDFMDFEKMSSGETHMIVLLGTLLFGTQYQMDELDGGKRIRSDLEYSLVLVDEPEISLHPVWQRELSAFMRTLAKDYGKQFVIATHSPTFIGNDWDHVINLFELEP